MKPLDDERRSLAESHRHFAIRIALQWGRRLRWHPDDVIGPAELGLCLAASRWQDRGIPFPTYARATIEGEIRHAIRAERGRIPAIPDPDAMAAGSDDAGDDGRIATLYEAMGALPAAHREAAWLVVGLGLTATEAAERLACSRSGAHAHARRAVIRLRAAMADVAP